ncbi:prepilin peptidase [Seminibacterium arietis]|uniref:Prepilin peptidase n=1 Tax=Seminibacterium arietis TaxID=1173502 RepID=A0ABW3I7W7_9PAST
MNYFLFFILGSITGIAVFRYISTFIENIKLSIYQSYTELFPHNLLPFSSEQSILQPKKCGHSFVYLLGFALFFIYCLIVNQSILLSLWWAYYGTLLFTISLVDWQYQLISPNLCRAIFVLNIIGSYFNLNELSLEESILSSFSAFSIFYVIYYIAKWIYKKEVLGRGDYWLMLGLGGIIYWENLPLLIFIASFTASLYGLYQKIKLKSGKFLPFAPFLCCANLIMLYIQFNYLMAR